MNTKIFAIAAVVILVGGIAGAIALYNNNDEDSAISIVDGSGRTIKLDKPLTKVAVINSNIPKGMIMLGLDDDIKCYHYTSKFGIKAESDPEAKLGSYYNPSVEKILSYGVDAVLCGVTSMTLTASVAKSCEENGMKVIRLDCYGDSLLDDLKKLSKIFGDPETAVKAMDRYQSEYNAMIDAIGKAIAAKDKVNYLYMYTGLSSAEGGSVVNERSGLSEILAPFFLKDVTEYTDLAASVTGMSNPLNDGTKEALLQVQNKIDCFVMRLNMDDDGVPAAVTEFNKYVGEGKILTSAAPAYANNKIAVVNTNLASGLYGHIGILLMVSYVYDVEVEGYTDINKVISDLQKWTGVDMIEDDECIFVGFNNDGTHSDLVYTEA